MNIAKISFTDMHNLQAYKGVGLLVSQTGQATAKQIFVKCFRMASVLS